jgi:hypothetical protein
MITITQVKRSEGQVVLTIEYSTDDGNEALTVDAEQIVDRLKALRALLGRKPTQTEAREIVVALINEVRQGKQPFVEVVPWETFIGIDLEA